MRNSTILSLSFSLLAVGCSSAPTYKVGGHSFSLLSGLYQTNGSYFCNGLAPDQILAQLTDYDPACQKGLPVGMTSRDPATEHSEIDFVFSKSANPNFRNAFPVQSGVSCDSGGGPLYVVYLYFKKGTDAPTKFGDRLLAADQKIVAQGGSVQITQYNDGQRLPFEATYKLDFGQGQNVNGTFNIYNCN
jgi:hypothetical protein